jgi:DUF4097 and DUF4098 domain-containing protein YvlB
MKSNIKKAVIVLVIIMFGSFAVATIIFYTTGGTSIVSTGKQDIDSSAVFDIGKISSISINSISSDISISTVNKEGNEINVHFYGTATANLKSAIPKLNAKLIGDELNIQLVYPKNLTIFGIYSTDTKIDVSIPKNYKDTIKKIDIKTTDANALIKELSSEEFNFNSTSGDLKTELFTSNKYNITTTSGDVKITGFIGAATVNTISGDVYLEHDYQHDLEGDLNVKTISGNASLKLPKNSEFYLKLNSISGILSNNFPITLKSAGKTDMEGIVGSDKYKVIVETVSGDTSLFY